MESNGFINSMKILFNLMDTENSGKISLSEIEVRWKDQNSREIISHLKKITPASGLLSFERFTSGLQMFLSTQKIQNNKTPKSRQFSQNSSSNLLTTVGIPDASNLMGPPKPPRMMFPSSSYEKDQQLSKMEIMTNLQKWQQNLLLANGTNQQRHTGDGQQKINPKRRDPRRHTLQNGIDYNMLKRLKQIELEKDILMQGLNTVETARSWYAKQISAVDEKLRYMTLTGNHTDQWTETYQERLDLQRVRVNEVNRYLMALIENWERGVSVHMNLEIRRINPEVLYEPSYQQRTTQFFQQKK